MDIVYDERQWKVRPTLDRKQCPFLYFPANLYGCLYNGKSKEEECNYDTCPIKLIESKDTL